ncbi:MAG: hypothetical protein K0U52_00690 [Gammaproteobacteria bacterium]|nr:hypothetical protein [Gammaproteobacteria bacterium]
MDEQTVSTLNAPAPTDTPNQLLYAVTNESSQDDLNNQVLPDAPWYYHPHVNNPYQPAKRRSPLCFRCNQKGHTTHHCKTYKVAICKFWVNNACNREYPDGTNDCSYAHGNEEQRHTGPHCVRIIHEDGEMTVEGCGQSGHRVDECPQSNTTSQ